MESSLVITEDGSTSVFIPELDEHYHSIHGALQESIHVFIDAGLKYKIKQSSSIDILEMGFGTGLNALLTSIIAEENNSTVNYTAIEKYPLIKTIISELNYCSLIEYNNCFQQFKLIHSCDWETDIEISNYFKLKKCKSDIEDVVFAEQFDIIYFDAFAPSAQPELWTETIFNSMFKALKAGGVLVTYCAKGIVKRRMKQSGFLVETLPGPIGKREMTRAVKPLT
jgi:tRNA U34 5-methylaminomethyl-2-thiouridine-forming methyltransferase MnmC